MLRQSRRRSTIILMRLRQRPACPLLACLLARLCLPGKSRLDWHRPAAQETYTQTYSIYPHTLSYKLNICPFLLESKFPQNIFFTSRHSNITNICAHIIYIGRNIYSIYSKLSTHLNKLLSCLWNRSTLLKFEAISFDKCQVGCSAVVQRHDVYFIYAADQSLGTSFFLLQARHETHLSLHKYRI